MKKFRNALLITLSVLVVLCSGFLALVYIPSLKFEPLSYEPIAPDTWLTIWIEVVEVGVTGEYKYSGFQQQ